MSCSQLHAAKVHITSLGFKLGDENPLRTYVLLIGFLQAFSGFHGITQVIKYGEAHVYHHYIHWNPQHLPDGGVFLDFFVETILGLILIHCTLRNDHKNVHHILNDYWLPIHAVLSSISTVSFVLAYYMHRATFEENFINAILFLTHFIQFSIAMTYSDKIDYALQEVAESESVETAEMRATNARSTRRSYHRKSQQEIRASLIQRIRRYHIVRR